MKEYCGMERERTKKIMDTYAIRNKASLTVCQGQVGLVDIDW